MCAAKPVHDELVFYQTRHFSQYLKMPSYIRLRRYQHEKKERLFAVQSAEIYAAGLSRKCEYKIFDLSRPGMGYCNAAAYAGRAELLAFDQRAEDLFFVFNFSNAGDKINKFSKDLFLILFLQVKLDIFLF